MVNTDRPGRFYSGGGTGGKVDTWIKKKSRPNCRFRSTSQDWSLRRPEVFQCKITQNLFLWVLSSVFSFASGRSVWYENSDMTRSLVTLTEWDPGLWPGRGHLPRAPLIRSRSINHSRSSMDNYHKLKGWCSWGTSTALSCSWSFELRVRRRKSRLLPLGNWSAPTVGLIRSFARTSQSRLIGSGHRRQLHTAHGAGAAQCWK